MCRKKLFLAHFKITSTGFKAVRKNSKYFFGLEKNRTKRPIVSIDLEGREINDPSCILSELREFYRKLYKNKDKVCEQSYLDKSNVPKVSETDKNDLDYPIRIQELEIAMNSMKLDKCPGNDGFPVGNFIRKCGLKSKFHSMRCC